VDIDHLRGFAGAFVILIIAWLLSENRRIIPWRIGVAAMGLQIALIVVVTVVPGAREYLGGVDRALDALQKATNEGTRFTFGYLAGGAQPFEVKEPSNLFVLAFQVLPLMIVISALSAVLWRWGVLGFVCRMFSVLFEKTLGVSGVIGFATAANIFLGMIESPLAIRPYLSRLSRSEMFVIMTTGMATVAGTVMAIYAALLRPTLPDAALHILTASFMAAPGSILVARLMVPETQEGTTKVDAYVGEEYSSTIQAFATGVEEGVRIFFNVIGMLIAATAVVALLNMAFNSIPPILGAPLSVERVFGWVLAPLAWIMGVPWAECGQAGGLMGIKAVLNELIAYIRLSEIPADALSERTRLIMTYALCGFANFAGAAVMVGGLSAICPERRNELGALGMKSILSGILTTSITGALAGAFYGLG
jgi:CNT family concentrative nucleoside transporter